MSDGQFPPESPQDPASGQNASSEPDQSEQPGLAPIGTPAPDSQPESENDPAIGLPGGSQYPDDMFGGGDDEVVIELPDDASSGGLADVGMDYGDGVETPLPPAVEPQDLADSSLDPQAAAPTGGDMFNVDDLMDSEPDDAAAAAPPAMDDDAQAQPAAPLPTPSDDTAGGDDLFSVDQLMTEDSEAPSEQKASPPPLQMPDPASTPAPLETPTAEDAPAPLETSAPLETPPAMETPVPAEPVAESEPLAQQPEPTAQPEPPTQPEPMAEQTPVEEPAQEVAPLPTPEPAAAPDASESLPEQPVSDTAKVYSQESIAEPPSSLSGGVTDNPYAAETSEAEVLDPAQATTADVEPPSEAEDGGEMKIVNPYAEEDDEAGVLDPAMSLKAREGEQPEEEHEVFLRTESEEFVETPADGAIPGDGLMPGEVSAQADGLAPQELPPTNRTESVSPPGMENMVVGGLVVANGGRAAKKPAFGKSKSSRSKRKSKSLSFGRGKKSADNDQAAATPAEAPDPAPAAAPAAAPVATQGVSAQSQATPGKSKLERVFGEAKPGERHSFFGIKFGPAAPMPGEAPTAAEPAATQAAAPVAEQSKPKQSKLKRGKSKTPKQAKPKQSKLDQAKRKSGKSKLDRVFGEAKPGERHSFFGIKFGPAAPMPGEAPVAQAAPAQSAVAEPAPAPAPAAPEPTATPAPLTQQTQGEHFDVGQQTHAANIEPPAVVPAPPSADDQPPLSQSLKIDESAGAVVIQSAESAAHAKRSRRWSRAKKPKAPKVAKQPKPEQAKLRQGKSMLDRVFGEVKPGERHSFFGIKFGPAAPMPGEAPVAQAAPSQPVEVAAPAASTAPAAETAQAAQLEKPVQTAPPPMSFPGGYPADFARGDGTNSAATPVDAGGQAMHQIVPPVEQTAQVRQQRQ